MPIRIADIFANLSVRTADYDRGLQQAQQKAGVFSNFIQGIFQGAGQRAFGLLTEGIESLISRMGDAVNKSSDLNESINKTGVVFGNAAAGVVEWSQTSDRALGLSQQKALEAASSFGALFVQMGQGRSKAAEMSEGLLQIAADLASINNKDPAAVFAKIKSGLAGESEPLKDLNIFLNENVVAQKAVQLGLAQSKDAVTEQAKVMARYALIVEQSAYAQGDQARTARELANAQRTLAAEVETGTAKLGDSFRPAVTAITNILADLAPQMFQYAQAAMDQFANGLAAGIRAIIPAITVVRQLLAYWFAPGSPPRVAPDIDKWGTAAMQQFIGGFTAVDVKGAMSSIGSALEQILRSDVSAGKADEGGLVSRVIGSRNAIAAAVAEFKQIGSVAQSTIDRIARSAGSSGGAVASLVKSYFDLQKATDAVNRAQSQLNDITARYDAIISPLQSQLDGVRAEQQKLADQQRLIAAKNTLASFDSSAADKRAAQLEIEQISLEAQINSAEQKKKAETDAAQAGIDAAKQQQDAEQKKLDIAQATIDQQVQINNLLGEQKQLEERLAQQREADAKRQEAEAEQAANKAKQQAEQAQRLADQLHDAQLRYNLEISDTPGKIKLMEAELAKTTVGSAEYYGILTQIHQLQEQYNKELERAAKQAGDLANGDIGTGIGGNITEPLGKASAAGENLAKALQEAFAPLPEATEKTKALADKLGLLVDKLAALFGIDFSVFTNKNKESLQLSGDEWDHYEERVKIANDGATSSFGDFIDSVSRNLDDLNNLFALFKSLSVGDWSAAWDAIKAIAENNFKLTGGGIIGFLMNATANFNQWFTENTAGWGKWFADTSKAMGQWLTDTANQISSFGSTLYQSGQALLGGFWDGLKDKWGEISSWFTDKLASLRAQLPFSEPKDASSPLRGLSKSGAAMVNMIQAGINSTQLDISGALPEGGLLAGATTNNTTTNGYSFGPFHITVNGNATKEDVQTGVQDAILSALRAKGL